MNKLALALIFSTIVVIKGISVNNYNTEPYHSFDWLDDDENKFKIEYTLNDGESISGYFCYLYNQSVACKTSCETSSSSTLESASSSISGISRKLVKFISLLFNPSASSLYIRTLPPLCF